MFERFTQLARQTVVEAQVAARRLNHGWIGTEHLLLGLLADDGGIAARVLTDLGITSEAVEREILSIVGAGPHDDAQALAAIGIDLDEVRRRVEASFGPGALQWPPAVCGRGRKGRVGPHVPFTPRAKKVLELSLREAVRLKHNYIGTEHILLGLLREGEGLACEVLFKLGAGMETTRARVLDELRRAG